MSKRKVRKDRVALVILVPVVCIAILVMLIVKLTGSKEQEPEKQEPVASVTEETNTNEETKEDVVEEETTPKLDESVFIDTESLLIIANKKHRLPEGYVPNDLVLVTLQGNQEAYMKSAANDALNEMAAAASQEGVSLTASSAYRSESYQQQLYDGYVSQYGVERADAISSRPGYSDHQTGLCMDFIEFGAEDANFTAAFESTASGQWLYEHAWEYGFVIRYPKDKAEYTGYTYEPWHYRYIGKEYAKMVHDAGSDVSIEECFNVSGGDYES